MKIELTEENVLLAGRTYKEGDTLWLALSSTGASFIYTGKKLFITVVGSPVINHEDAENNCARIAVYVNGERKVDDMVTQASATLRLSFRGSGYIRASLQAPPSA